jgi:hypothetical protein
VSIAKVLLDRPTVRGSDHSDQGIKIRVNFRQKFHKKGIVMGSKASEPEAAFRKRGTNFLPSNLAFASINLLIPGL